MVENTKNEADNSASIEEDADHAVPDAELLTFQKQRSTPKVRLSEVVDGEEIEHLAIDDFAKHDCENTEKPHYGMMKSGGEEKVVKELIKAGTLDSDGMPHAGDISPSLKLKQDMAAAADEEQK